jgi:hypothetical protein
MIMATNLAFALDALPPWAGIAVGLLLLAVGAWLLRRAWRRMTRGESFWSLGMGDVGAFAGVVLIVAGGALLCAVLFSEH